MQTIKFSHRYYKMPFDFEESTLLEVFTVNGQHLSKAFLEWDTAIENGGYYELPEGVLLVLLLQTNSKQLWTTIRKWDAEKERYYRALRGEKVACKIIEEKERT